MYAYAFPFAFHISMDVVLQGSLMTDSAVTNILTSLRTQEKTLILELL